MNKLIIPSIILSGAIVTGSMLLTSQAQITTAPTEEVRIFITENNEPDGVKSYDIHSGDLTYIRQDLRDFSTDSNGNLKVDDDDPKETAIVRKIIYEQLKSKDEKTLIGELRDKTNIFDVTVGITNVEKK